MCLDISKQERKKVAEADIVCYKLLFKLGSGENATIFQKAMVEEGEEYTSPLERIRRGNTVWVEIGLHSFISVNDTLSYAQFWKALDSQLYYIAECIIPKGAKYYSGTFGPLRYRSYASDKIKYVKIEKLCV